MAFTGAAVVTRVSDRVVRITGVSLAGDASGVLGFPNETVPAEVSWGAFPDWLPRALANGTALTLADLIECRITIVTDVTTPVPISVVKSGTTQLDFKITLHNDTAATAGPDMEIWVEYH